MKVKAVVTFDTEDGNYEISYHNLSQKGGSMDYGLIQKTLKNIFGDVDKQIEDLGFNSSEQVIKEIH